MTLKKSYISIFSIILICFNTYIFSFAKENEKEDRQYKLSVGDILHIEVYDEPDLSGDFEIREGGVIKYHLLGMVKVEKLTNQEIENKLSQLLEKDYLVNPFVRVNLKESRKSNILIVGSVEKPGSYAIPPGRGLTLLEALLEAGGATRYASINGVRIVKTSADGEKIVVNPHLDDTMKGKKEDVKLEPNDLVIVPERLF